MNAYLAFDAGGACRLAGHPLHPAAAPQEAAGRELGGPLQTARPGDLVILAGGGLGWYARAWLAWSTAHPGVACEVFEPDPRLAAEIGRHAVHPPEVPLCAGDGAIAERLAKHLVYGDKTRYLVFSPPAYGLAFPGFAGHVRELVQAALDRRRINQTVTTAKAPVWRDNLLANLGLVFSVPDLTQLVGRCRGIPALIVGAGPSLDDSYPLLRQAQGKCLVFCAASALHSLAANGILPQLVFALEGKDESRQFVAGLPPEVALAAASSSHPQHFRAWRGGRFLFHLQGWLNFLTGLGTSLPTGGHANSAAFSCAVLLGCDPLILVGQDLAFSHGRTHAAARPGGAPAPAAATRQVPALDGGRVETSPVFQNYLDWYRDSARYLATLPRPPRLFNATAQGASIEGFPPLDAAQAAAFFCSRPAGRPELGRLGKSCRLPALPAVRANLARLARLVEEANGTGGRAADPGRDSLAAEFRQSGVAPAQLAAALAAAGGGA